MEETGETSIVNGLRIGVHKGVDIEATWHLHGLSSLQETLTGNVLYPMINPGQWNLKMGRIS